MEYSETIADKLSAAGWSWDLQRVSPPNGWRWIVDARKGDARRCIVESDELLSAFLELEAMVAVGATFYNLIFQSPGSYWRWRVWVRRSATQDQLTDQQTPDLHRHNRCQRNHKQ